MLLEDSKIRDKSYKNPNQILQISHGNYMEFLFWVVGNGKNLGAPNFAPKSGEIELYNKCLFPITNFPAEALPAHENDENEYFVTARSVFFH
jgi:hypothetical protein